MTNADAVRPVARTTRDWRLWVGANLLAIAWTYVARRNGWTTDPGPERHVAWLLFFALVSFASWSLVAPPATTRAARVRYAAPRALLVGVAAYVVLLAVELLAR